MNENELLELRQELAVVNFAMDLGREAPDMYSFEEKVELSLRYDMITSRIDEILREDYESMSSEEKNVMRKTILACGIPEDIWNDIFGDSF